MDAAQIALILTAVSSLFDDNLTPLADPIIADHAAHHSDSVETSTFQLILSNPGVDSPSSLPLARAELLKFDGDGDLSQVPGIDVKMLPLVAVLWDLSSHHIGNKALADDAPSNHLIIVDSMRASVEFLIAPLLVVNMSSVDDSRGGLPAVQSAKISFPAGDGAIHTHEIQHLDQLPAILIVALQGAVHTQIEGASAYGSSGSFSLADTLIAALTTSHNGSATPDGSTTAKATATIVADNSSSGAASAQTSDAAATNHGVPLSAVELGAILENFIQHSTDYSIISTGKAVVVYDAHALGPDQVHTVSFDFQDGSSLSLVGLSAALPHAYMMA